MKLVPRAIRLMRPSLFEFIKSQQDFDECMIFNCIILVSVDLMKWVHEQKLTLSIYKIYDLSDASQAHDDLEGKKTSGKLVLKI